MNIIKHFHFHLYLPVIQILLSFCHHYRPDTYACISVDAEHTDPPIDVDQNVAYRKHIELQDNVCYTTSFRKEDSEYGSV